MIAVLGLSHKTAPVGIRESFHISKEEISPLGDYILQQTEVTELVILSTCNRTEIYFYHNKNCYNKTIKNLKDILSRFKGINEDFSDYFYSHSKHEAVQHLFKVTSGVDSLVIGEDQVVKQVKEAYTHCTKLALTDAVLMRLFQKSFETSKLVRSKTSIQHGATSVSYVAADMYSKSVENINDKKILLVGTGETGKIALSHLRKKGANRFKLTNRTFDVAKSMADQFGGTAIPFESFREHLYESDVVITATNANQNLISVDDVNAYDFSTRKHPQYFIDLSIPRNIDKNIGALNNINLIGVDDLHGVTEKTDLLRKQSVIQADALINNMVEEFYQWMDNRALRPIIKTISKSFQEIKLMETNISRSCYSEDEMRIVEEFGNRLSQKYVNALIKNLKSMTANGHDTSVMLKIQEVFQMLNEEC